MNSLTQRIRRSTALTALLLITVLILTCTAVMGVAAADGDTYTLKLEAVLYDEIGEEWPVGIQTELAEGDTIDTDALVATLVANYPYLADSALSAEGFIGLPADGKMPASDLTLNATFELRPFTVTWIVDGVATEQKVAYGKLPAFEGSTDKAADAQYTYTFAGWDTEPVEAYEDATYTAQYTETVNEYTVTWIVDGVTTTETYKYGETPSFKGSTDKAATAQYTYIFAGWDKTLAAIEGDVTYTAQYDSTVNEYTVTWIVDGVTTTETYKYGETPSFKGSTDKAATARYTYTFAGWDKTLAAVEGDVTYTAQYTETVNEYTVTWIVDGKETTAQVPYGTVPGFGSTPSKPAAGGYSYIFKGWDKEIVAVTGDVTYTAVFEASANEVTITFKVDGQADVTVVVKVGETPAYPNGTPSKAADAQYTYTFKGWDKEIAAATEDATYTAQFDTTVRKYYVYFYYGHNTVLPLIVEYGQAAQAPTNTDKAPTESTVFEFAGWDVDFSNITGTLKVYAKYTESVRTYTVTFNYGDGKTETMTVEYGKGATAPTDTDKAATEEFTYTFKGWDADFSEITADLTVNAQYEETPVKEPETETSEPDTDPVEPDTNEPETNEPETPAETNPETDPETNEPVVTDPETTAPDSEPDTTPVTGDDGCGGSWWWIVLVILVVAGVAVVVIILLRRKGEPETTEPETQPEPEVAPEAPAETAPLFIPVGEEIPEEEIPAEVETVEEVAATDVDDLMTDKVAAAFLVASDEEGGQGKMGIINVGLISSAYQAGETVDLASLQAKGMIDGNVGRLKVLASGTLDKPLIIKADAFSVQAVKMITLTGGQAIELKGE